MEFDLAVTRSLLENTPSVLERLVGGVDERWLNGNEGPDTWSPVQVVGHLIDAERQLWIPRALRIGRGERGFAAFDRFAHLQLFRDAEPAALLALFREERARSLTQLDALDLRPRDLERTAEHPEFGRVTLRQLLATWAVHDMAHLAQICRTMAKQYSTAIGPWKAYIRAVQD